MDDLCGTRVARAEALSRLQQANEALRERVKELNCLYGISNLVQTPGISLEEILQGTVELIPAAWQYPAMVLPRSSVGAQTPPMGPRMWRSEARLAPLVAHWISGSPHDPSMRLVKKLARLPWP